MNSIVRLYPKPLTRIVHHKNTLHMGLMVFAAIMAATFSMCRNANTPVLVLNPYEEVNWDLTTHHKANFHAHTTQTDGNYPPHEVVDQYHQLGYSLLSLTDHDRITYPWTDFSELNDQYQDRDPDSLGMLAIVGNELSRHHHTLSLFTDFQAQSQDLDVVLKNQADHSGDALAVLAHPAMHWPRQFDTEGELTDSVVDYYAHYYLNYEHLVGIEIHNGTRPMTEYPLDRALWDRLLKMLMPERPVWGFATDDIHASVQYGRDWVVLPLDELSTEAARTALKSGAFYVSSIRLFEGNQPDKLRTPVIESIIHDKQKGVIKIQASTQEGTMLSDAIQWISDGEVIHTGPDFPYTIVEGLGNYVRAEIYGHGGTTYTNPFGFAR